MSPTMPNAVQAFYRDHPRMVSSPFGGVHDWNDDLTERVFNALGIDLAGQAVLDAGCGRGFAAGAVRAMGGRYFGADFVISRAGFPMAQADAQALPFADDAFDAVLCVDAFEHFPEPGEALREFRRVLRPGGVFFLSAPNYANAAGVVKWWCERFGKYERDSWAPFGRWQPQELEQALTPGKVKRWARAAGFTQAQHIGHGDEVGLGLFPWLDHPRMPDSVRFRAQRLFGRIGPPIARVWPSASLHVFYRFE